MAGDTPLQKICDVEEIVANRGLPGRAPSVKMASPGKRSVVNVVLFIFAISILIVQCKDTKPKKKKDIRDYNDADMARLLEQWEVCRSFIYPSLSDNSRTLC